MKKRPILLAIFATAMLGSLCAPARAQQRDLAPSAAAAFEELEEELSQLYAQMIARYERATPQQRQALPDINLWPRQQVMPKLAAAAKRFAGTPHAVKFDLWIVRDSRRLTDQTLAVAAIDRLLADHIEDGRLVDLANWLPRYSRSLGVPRTLTILERLRQQNGDRKVQAASMLARASVAPGSEQDLKARLREVIAFAPETASGQRAKARLFAIEHLQIGCTAPDIAGIDLDGVAFQLSDYRGKVVFLDFWGDW